MARTVGVKGAIEYEWALSLEDIRIACAGLEGLEKRWELEASPLTCAGDVREPLLVESQWSRWLTPKQEEGDRERRP